MVHAELERPAKQVIPELLHAAAAQAAPDGVKRLQALVGRSRQRRDIESGPVGDDRLDPPEALGRQGVGDRLVVPAPELAPADVRLQEIGDQRLDAEDRNHLNRQLAPHPLDVEHREREPEVEDQRLEPGIAVQAGDVPRIVVGDRRVAGRDDCVDGRLDIEEASQVEDHPLEVEGASLDPLELVPDLLGPGDAPRLKVLPGAAAERGEIRECLGRDRPALEERVAMDVDDRQMLDLYHA